MTAVGGNSVNKTLHPPRIELTIGAGLLSRIASILSRTSGVSLGMTSNAFKLSRTCSGFEAPRMTVLVLGFLATQANAR